MSTTDTFTSVRHDGEERTVRRSRHVLVAMAALAMVALGVAGCANEPDTTTSGAGGGGETTTASGGEEDDSTDTTTARDKAVEFAACIRENGVSDFPDPNASGEFIFGINVAPDVWLAAVDSCKHLQPPGSLSAERAPEQQSAGLEFAQCIRDNGVSDFPDPVQGEPLIDTGRIPSAERPGGMAVLDAALEACRDLLDAAAEGQ